VIGLKDSSPKEKSTNLDGRLLNWCVHVCTLLLIIFIVEQFLCLQKYKFDLFVCVCCSVHPYKENVFEVVTRQRVFYIQVRLSYQYHCLQFPRLLVLVLQYYCNKYITILSSIAKGIAVLVLRLLLHLVFQ